MEYIVYTVEGGSEKAHRFATEIQRDVFVDAMEDVGLLYRIPETEESKVA